MAPKTLVINVTVGVLFVLIWGVLSYIASSDIEFKSFFFGGLANFVFFIGGALATYFSSRSSSAPSSAAQPIIPQKNGFDVPMILYIAIATMSAVILANLFQEGFTNSLDRLEHLGTIAFRPDGYRDIQIYAGGSFSILCFLGALMYGVYLGSIHPSTTYLTVLTGVSVSLGMQCFLYAVFGIFFDSQLFQILNVSTPPVLDTYSPVLKRLFGVGITLATGAAGVLMWTTLVWLSIKLGGLGRLKGPVPKRP